MAHLPARSEYTTPRTTARTAVRLLRWAVGLLHALALILWTLAPAAAAPLPADAPPSGPIGLHARVLVDPPDARGDLDVARARLVRGEARMGARPVFAAGIDAPPTWLVWELDNPLERPAHLRLTLANAWIDRIDLYQVAEGQPIRHWRAGDALPQAARPVAGPQFAFDLEVLPGRSELFLRTRTADPLVLPVYLETPAQAAGRSAQAGALQAFVSGYLLALIGYNLLIWFGVRKRSHLLYAVYLGSFLLLNLAYTGYGYQWLWPDSPAFQRYVILVLMVAYVLSGLCFARRFLDMHIHAPRLNRVIRLTCVAWSGALVACVAGGQQALTASLAFLAVCIFSPVMVWLGVVALRAGHRAAGYFLAATLAGSAGALLTALAVLGFIGFTPWTFHAAELGMLTDATLLALALAHRFRLNEANRQRAETLARTDPLTDLWNRRAFYEQADATWSTALRNGRPLSVVVMDIDRFKHLNDVHGHAVGDLALSEVGRVLSTAARRGDIVARWGGEEFVLLLPETDGHQAAQLAERLRRQLGTLHLPGRDGTPIGLSASFGVCDRTGIDSLDALVDAADSHLRQAKLRGRDRVVHGGPEPRPEEDGVLP